MIEIATSGLEKELRDGLLKALHKTKYATHITRDHENIICRLFPKSDEVTFNDLIDKTVNLIVAKTERYEKKRSSVQLTHPHPKKKGAKGYRNRKPALATT